MLEKVITKAHPVSGLICFHGYLNPYIKTMPIDIIYVAMDNLTTKTKLSFDTKKTSILINDAVPDERTVDRITQYVGHYTKKPFLLQSWNNFGMGVGLASSASGYAALAGALAKALGKGYNNTELSRIARSGSISAASSIIGGLSIIRTGGYNHDPPAEIVMAPEELDDLTIVVGCCDIKKNTQDNHREARTSPFYKAAIEYSKQTASRVIKALEKRDIENLAQLVENHNLMNYTVLHSGKGQNILWAPKTVAMMEDVRKLRKKGHPIFFSMNTGANIYCYCFDDKSTEQIKLYFEGMNIETYTTKVGGGLE